MIRLPAERCGVITYIPLGGTPDPVEAAEKLAAHTAADHPDTGATA